MTSGQLSLAPRGAAFALLALSSCGYHVSGRADLLPKSIKTIAIPAFANNTTRYRLNERLPQAITREFISRTRYQVVHDPNNADAVLHGSVTNIMAFPITFDTATGRATGVQVNVILQINLIERATGKVLYTNPGMEVRERYEISRDQLAYFEESDTALDRLGKQVAGAVVSVILEAF
ncbi:MAG: LptE family protein [Acidobacteria bacterium]|nr:LptE family protein [Acidobacteriota bacterium]